MKAMITRRFPAKENTLAIKRNAVNVPETAGGHFVWLMK